MKIIIIILLILGMLALSYKSKNGYEINISLGLITNTIILLLIIFKVVTIL